MIGALARKFFGSANDRRIKGYQSRVDAINALEPEVAALSDEALKARTAEFKQQLASGKTLDDILVPAFATVREAAERRGPQLLPAYSIRLADDFHRFYHACRVLGDPAESFRLGLCAATQRVIARSLDLVGVEAPDRM